MKWHCLDCGDTFESDTTRHSMDYCGCGEQWVDHEEYSIRRSMGVVAYPFGINVAASRMGSSEQSD